MKKYRLLIADDEPWFMEAITDRLNVKFPNLEFDFVVNGSQVLKEISETTYNLIVLDMMLPLGPELTLPLNEPDLMFGIYVLRKIRENEKNKSISVICYTVLDEDIIKKDLEILNARYISKIDENSMEHLFFLIENILK